MILDHASVWLVPKGTPLDIFLHVFGRLAAPIMCFLIAEGYFYTSDIKKYTSRLFLLAVVSHFAYLMYFDLKWWQATSVIWSLTMGLVALIACLNTKLSLWMKPLVVALCCMLAWTANWNYIGVLWIVFLGIFRDNFKKQIISFAIIGIFLYAIPGVAEHGWIVLSRFGVLLAIPIFALYNGKIGKKSNLIKWGFYIIYPLHLIVLYILRFLLFA